MAMPYPLLFCALLWADLILEGYFYTMKKLFSLTLCLVLMLSVSVGLSNTSASADSGKLHVLTTIFPEYDWVMNILGDQSVNANVTMLLDNGVDLHSYQPTVDDIVNISTCDLFIYVGGESDDWVNDALKEATNQNMIVLNLLEILGDTVKEEEIVEGMEVEEEHDHGHDDHAEDEDHEEDHHHEEEEEEIEYDEHVWLSLRNASLFCTAFADALSELDAENAETYRANATAYQERLDALDAEYRAALDGANGKTILFGDRFPFRYLTDDYGLTYYAAFVGCSAETEASFETVVFLASKVDELGLNSICQIESSDGSLARTIRDNTQSKDQEILTLDSMQATTASDVADGASYLSIMETNLALLKAALQ